MRTLAEKSSSGQLSQCSLTISDLVFKDGPKDPLLKAGTGVKVGGPGMIFLAANQKEKKIRKVLSVGQWMKGGTDLDIFQHLNLRAHENGHIPLLFPLAKIWSPSLFLLTGANFHLWNAFFFFL